VPPLPQTMLDLQARITTAIAAIDHDMLQRVWQAGCVPSYQGGSH
jgi:hypothetical protein